jgi:hypothetical protein
MRKAKIIPNMGWLIATDKAEKYDATAIVKCSCGATCSVEEDFYTMCFCGRKFTTEFLVYESEKTS